MSNAHKPRIMYIEYKGGGFVPNTWGAPKCREGSLTGPAHIGRVTFSKTGATLYYKEKAFQSLKGSGFKANFFDVQTGEQYWISGPRKDGTDSLYATNIATEIDEEVRREYWTQIRERPQAANQSHT